MILRRDPLCAYCRARGRVEVATTVDHIVPVARGGAFWDQDNLAPACAYCNYSKADQTADEFLAGSCDQTGFGSFWDEKSLKNQTSLAAQDRGGPFLHTKLDF